MEGKEDRKWIGTKEGMVKRERKWKQAGREINK